MRVFKEGSTPNIEIDEGTFREPVAMFKRASVVIRTASLLMPEKTPLILS